MNVTDFWQSHAHTCTHAHVHVWFDRQVEARGQAWASFLKSCSPFLVESVSLADLAFVVSLMLGLQTCHATSNLFLLHVGSEDWTCIPTLARLTLTRWTVPTATTHAPQAAPDSTEVMLPVCEYPCTSASFSQHRGFCRPVRWWERRRLSYMSRHGRETASDMRRMSRSQKRMQERKEYEPPQRHSSIAVVIFIFGLTFSICLQRLAVSSRVIQHFFLFVCKIA